MGENDIFQHQINIQKTEAGSLKNEMTDDKQKKKSPTGIQINVLSDKGTLKSTWFPYIPKGQYRFESDFDDDISNFFHIESKDDKWYGYCNSPCSFIKSGNIRCQEIGLFNRHLIPIESAGKKYVLYTEIVDNQSSIFRNYFIYKSSQISIGRATDNDIIYPNALASRYHATIDWNDNSWWIHDCNSANGVYVNDMKVNEAPLKTGDVIFILGLRIIMGAGFISINDGNNRATVTSKKLKYLDSTKNIIFSNCKSNNEGKNQLFNRLPRRRTAMSPKKIVIEGPPMSLNAGGIPLILRMGGSMVMGGTAALAGNYTMLLSSVLFPLLTQKYTDKEKKEYEAKRIEKYGAYLEDKRSKIEEERKYEESVLNKNYPELNHVLDYPFSKTQLWERRKIDDDFLNLRLGFGEIPLLAEVEYPKHRFDMNEDKLEEQMFELAEQQVNLKNVPIITSIIENMVCGVTGTKKQSSLFIERLIIQISILHSYDEVKLVFLIESNDLKKMEYIKYIPHVWDDQRTVRFVATDTSEAYQIGEYMKREVGEDITKVRKLNEILKERPYYVVFALSKRIFDSVEVLKDIMQQESNCGVSVIAAFDDLPKECSLVFDLNGEDSNSVIYLKQIDRDCVIFDMDKLDRQAVIRSMKKISNTNLKVISQAYSLPKTVTFLEMFGVGRIEHLNPIKRWKDNNPVKSLSAPVGVATDGNLFTLDLHQKYQGPHGLVAGMTGSGKSEFLLTYILSMAVNYHPDEVAFVLIDYKGGGLAGAFDDPARGVHLPHLVGTITNLDGSTIQRSITSIQSELMRRQRIFNEAKSVTDEGTMDIYAYQRLYRSKAVSEPMPHLFIISDEFAELKQQQPEFMDQLISVARIGRSLGVHLILATQKPAGVVNDQIRSNTKFRVCLKVQDRSDSMDMLKRPEAAELKETGRFYLQVGYNEFFALGQSAWCGAPYEPEDEVVIQRDDSVQFIDSVGANVLEIKPKVRREATGGAQLVSIVKMLSDIAKENGIEAKSLWKPELPSIINLSEIVDEKADTSDCSFIRATIGVLDDPDNQKQYNFEFDFTHCKNLLIVGDAGSGKTTLIQNMLYSLTKHYSPELLNFYALDYSSRMIKAFKDLPHCGGVLFEEDADSLDKFFDLINGIVSERKKLFTKLEVDNFDAANTIQNIPLVLVVIDGLAGMLNSKKGESQSYKLSNYLKDCSNYGVKYIISCSHLNEVNSRVKQELGDRICLHLKDKYDYSEALECKVDFTPAEKPGRGMYVFQGKALEFQSAMCHAEVDDKRRIQVLKEECTALKERFENYAQAIRLPVVSESVSFEEFASQFNKRRIPLGYSKKDGKPIALPLKQLSMLSVYCGNFQGKVPIMENILYSAKREQMEVWIAKRKELSLFEKSSGNGINEEYYKDYVTYESNQEQLTAMWKALSEELKKRNLMQQEFCLDRGLVDPQNEYSKERYEFICEKTSPLLIFIENYADFCNNVDAISSMVFDKIFSIAHKRNAYIVAFFEPDDSKSISNNLLYSSFNPEEMILLFGGQFDKQVICDLPIDISQASKTLQFNLGLMKYQNSYYPLLMPCGEVVSEIIDEDEQSIF